MSEPRISKYGSQHVTNANRHDYPSLNVVIWYSYQTPVAFQIGRDELVVCENVWSKTTGKHLNLIDDGPKDRRLSREAFLKLWEEKMPKELKHLIR